MIPWVVMRSRNDMPQIAATLDALASQSRAFELIVFDNASTDGSAAEARKHTDRVVNVPAGQYVPGRVLNQGMDMSEGECVVFLNADATPVDELWLDKLLAAFTHDHVAAVFGRQVPRPGCAPLFAKDTEATFGQGARQERWRHCFSMASAAIRRSVWEGLRFDESLQYSEDIEWTWKARGMGFEVRYEPEAVVVHSHDYTLGEFYRRQRGEGRADARIFDWSAWERSLGRYSLLPYARQVLSDWKYCLAKCRPCAALYSPVLRLAGAIGRRSGFRAGLKEKAGK